MRSTQSLNRASVMLGMVAWLWADAIPALGQPADTTSLHANPAQGGSLIPFPILFYQPETGTGFGASVVYLFTLGEGTRPGDEGRSLRSSVAATAIYTAKKQVITSLNAEMFPGGGHYRALANVSFVRFPNSFWGIGNDTPDSLEEDYTPDQIAASAEFSVEVARHMYAGVFGQGGNRELREIEEGGLIATETVPGTQDGTLVTLGLLLTRDSRSSNVYPRSGEFHRLRASRSLDASGNGNDFSTLSLDLRAYVPIRSGVMAFRALGVASGEVPPFDLMPRLGASRCCAGTSEDASAIEVSGPSRRSTGARSGAGFAACCSPASGRSPTFPPTCGSTPSIRARAAACASSSTAGRSSTFAWT